MKTELSEGSEGFYLKLEPESVKDLAMLLRLSTKVRAGSISFETSFATDPYSFICGEWKKGNSVCTKLKNGKLENW